MRETINISTNDYVDIDSYNEDSITINSDELHDSTEEDDASKFWIYLSGKSDWCSNSILVSSKIFRWHFIYFCWFGCVLSSKSWTLMKRNSSCVKIIIKKALLSRIIFSHATQKSISINVIRCEIKLAQRS